MRNLRLVVLALLVAPAALVAQAPKARGIKAAIARAEAAADSSNFKAEFGSDLNVSQTGDSLPADVRIAAILGSTFTVEAGAAARKNPSYLEAEASLSLTGAIFPGATSVHGQFVTGGLVYHYEGGPHQFGVTFGTGVRMPAVNGIAARTSAFVEYLFPRAGLSSSTTVGAKIGISFWR